MNGAAERPLSWILSLNLLGLLSIASGLAWAMRSRSSEDPWFAPIVLGLVLVTWGWTIDDAARNDQLMSAPHQTDSAPGRTQAASSNNDSDINPENAANATSERGAEDRP